jgi:hypothetical protein
VTAAVAVTARLAGALAVLGWAAPAVAQQPAPPRLGREIQLAVTFAGAMPASLGSATVTFLANDGSPIVISRSESRVGFAPGLEAHVGVRLSRRVEIEATGTWLRAPYRTEITFDAEGAENVLATAVSSQFSASGAVLWTVGQKGRTSVFVRGAAGWLFDIVNQSLVESGPAVQAGGGVKYWWQERSPRARRRVGLRIEGRLQIRSDGAVTEPAVIRLTPIVSAGVIFGF